MSARLIAFEGADASGKSTQARRLAAEGATECHSSPYVRCVETLEPLASRIDTTVVIEPRLIEGAEAEPVVELLTEISEPPRN